MFLIFPPEPSKECVKVSHVIFECRVINHHPNILFCIAVKFIQCFNKNVEVFKVCINKTGPCIQYKSIQDTLSLHLLGRVRVQVVYKIPYRRARLA